MSELENTTILVVQLDPENHSLIITVDRQAGAKQLADKLNASERCVLQFSPTEIRLLGLASDQVTTLELEIPSTDPTQSFRTAPNPVLSATNLASIPSVEFVLAGRRPIAAVRLEAVEIYLNELPPTARYLRTLSPTCFEAPLRPASGDLSDSSGWLWSLN